jgi:hypothetical protein
LYQLAEMEEVLATNRRTVQFWTNAGALRASPDTHHGGRGVHRVYDVDEMVMGLVLRALLQVQLPIGRLLAIANTVRSWLGDPGKRAEVNKGIAGQSRVYLIIEGGNLLRLLIDPTSAEALEAMRPADSIHDSWRGTFNLTPWLRRTKSSLS